MTGGLYVAQRPFHELVMQPSWICDVCTTTHRPLTTLRGLEIIEHLIRGGLLTRPFSSVAESPICDGFVSTRPDVQ